MIKLENKLKDLILQNVEFEVDGKIIKRGRIKVFNTKQFFIKFKLENCDEIKEFELPYPYRAVKLENGFLFDYCLSAFCPKTEEIYWKMRAMNKESCSKIFDNYLYILTSES